MKTFKQYLADMPVIMPIETPAAEPALAVKATVTVGDTHVPVTITKSYVRADGRRVIKVKPR